MVRLPPFTQSLSLSPRLDDAAWDVIAPVDDDRGMEMLVEAHGMAPIWAPEPSQNRL